LFATDHALPDIIRIDLGSGSSDRVALGGLGGDLAVSRDGSLLVVARPAELDLQVFSDPTGVELAPLDADPLFGGLPECINPCGENLCGDHRIAASEAVCSDATGLATPAGM